MCFRTSSRASEVCSLSPVRADEHAQMSAESLPNFPQKFVMRRALPNPNFGRLGPSLVVTMKDMSLTPLTIILLQSHR